MKRGLFIFGFIMGIFISIGFVSAGSFVLNFQDEGIEHSGYLQTGAELVSEGVDGSAVEFDGADGYTYINNRLFFEYNLSLNNPLSVMGWFNPDVLKSKGNIINDSWISKNRSFSLSPKIDGSVWFEVSDFNGEEVVKSLPNSIDIKNWQHWAGVYNGTHLLLYKNGGLIAFNKISLDLKDSNEPICIGKSCDLNRDGNDNKYYDGKADEIKVYNSLISANEISKIYLDELDRLVDPNRIQRSPIFYDEELRESGSVVLRFFGVIKELFS